jgi:hypothetical protein
MSATMNGNRHPNTILVNTGSNEDLNKRLSQFYHLDAPTQLTIGHRIAEVNTIFYVSSSLMLCCVVGVLLLLLLLLLLLMVYHDTMLSFFQQQQKRNLIILH